MIKCKRCGEIWQLHNPKNVQIYPYSNTVSFDQKRKNKVKDADKISD